MNEYLQVEWDEDKYVASCISFSGRIRIGFGKRPQTLSGKEGLDNFLLNTIGVTQDSLDQALQGKQILLSPEQASHWPL